MGLLAGIPSGRELLRMRPAQWRAAVRDTRRKYIIIPNSNGASSLLLPAPPSIARVGIRGLRRPNFLES